MMNVVVAIVACVWLCLVALDVIVSLLLLLFCACLVVALCCVVCLCLCFGVYARGSFISVVSLVCGLVCCMLL